MIITNKGAKEVCLKAITSIFIIKSITAVSYPRMLTKFFDLMLDFSIDNTKFVLKCQAEFL